ncbi:MAG: phenylalanine--tRNA ligase subunit beta [Candidatus Omnitrophota bacterium]
MKITYNWLKDFVTITLAPRALAEKLTMAGLEVVSIEESNGDFVFEIEITSNRPDWLSVVGVAREVAALTNKKLKLSEPQPLRMGGRHALGIEVQEKKDCPLYTAKLIEGIKVGPSPEWLRQRLELIGCRSINNIVDITNYILFEWGEPLHAFDFDTLQAGAITVRRAKKEEKIVTIDGIERQLNHDVLVIADAKGPVAIAGIMGGRETQVGPATSRILLEAAVFNPVVVRRGRRMLGLESDSAYRFERGVDSVVAQEASLRAARLIRQIAGGTVSAAKISGVAKAPARRIALDTTHLRRALAVQIPPGTIKGILESLGFNVKAVSQKKYTINVPSFRQDVKIEVDLIEEIARIFGYGRIPTTIPRIRPQAGPQDDTALNRSLKEILIGLGLNEVITYSLIEKGWVRAPGQDADKEIAIANPLSKDQAVLRTTLRASLAQCVAYNLRQKQPYIAIFEIAHTYGLDVVEEVQEHYKLGIALCGGRMLWVGKDRVYDEAGLLHIKGILEVLFERLGIEKDAYQFVMRNAHEGQVYARGILVGTFVRLRKEMCERLDIKNKEVVEAEIDVETLLSSARLKRRFKPFARMPRVTRDTTIVVKDTVRTGAILDEIARWGMRNSKGLLQDAEVSKYYKGEQIPDDAKSLTISCTYCSPQRTLTDGEVNALHAQLVGELKKIFNAAIR